MELLLCEYAYFLIHMTNYLVLLVFTSRWIDLDVCLDYSFWQTNSSSNERCTPRQNDLRYRTHPSLCRTDQDKRVPCFDTFSNNIDWEKSYCRDNATKENCTDVKGNFFCEKSSTCIPQGKKMCFQHFISFSNDFYIYETTI